MSKFSLTITGPDVEGVFIEQFASKAEAEEYQTAAKGVMDEAQLADHKFTIRESESGLAIFDGLMDEILG